jgi:peptide/nickel transport system substrate-binding protein
MWGNGNSHPGADSAHRAIRGTCLLVPALLSVLLWISGCGLIPGAPGGAGQPGQGSGQAGQTPRYGGTLTLFMHQIGTCTLDPAIGLGSQDRHFNEMLGDPLARMDPATGEAKPALAKSWQITEGGRVWTFQLRDDVTFHDGTKFNAAAVKYNFDRGVRPEYIDKGGGAPYALGFTNYQKTEVLSEYEVRTTFKDPHYLFLERMSDRFTMHSPTAMDKHGDNYGKGNVMPVATGPFKVTDCDPNSHITLVRNEDYKWGSPIFKNQGRPYLDKLIIRGSAESATRRAGFDANEADMMYAAESDVADFKDKDGYRVDLAGKSGTTRMLGMNVEKPPFNDIRVRQAFAHSVDREGILVSPRYRGVGKVAYTILSGNPNWPRPIEDMKSVNYLYDPAKAKQLLEDAGWKVNPTTGYREKDGNVLEVHGKMPSAFLEEAEQVQAMAKVTGFKVTLEAVALGRWFEAQKQGEVHFTPHSYSGPGLYLAQYATGVEWYRYSNPDVDRWIQELSQEPDRTKRLDLADKIQRQVIQDAVVTPFVQDVYPFVMKSYVRDVFYPYTSWPLFQDAWLAR